MSKEQSDKRHSLPDVEAANATALRQSVHCNALHAQPCDLETCNLARAWIGKVTTPSHVAQSRHERRVVGHASGWQEQMDTCVCGKPWPCDSAAKDGCVGAVWTRDSTMAQQFRTKTEAENYAECYHIDDATATDHMFNCGISTAPSPLGGLAEVLAFYDELVDGPDPLDHQDAEADFVMRGSDWRTIRPAVCMPSATRRSDPLPEGWGWVPCTPKLLERHPSGCFMFIRRPGDQHHSHDHFVPPETLEVMNRADGTTEGKS